MEHASSAPRHSRGLKGHASFPPPFSHGPFLCLILKAFLSVSERIFFKKGSAGHEYTRRWLRIVSRVSQPIINPMEVMMEKPDKFKIGIQGPFLKVAGHSGEIQVKIENIYHGRIYVLMILKQTLQKSRREMKES